MCITYEVFIELVQHCFYFGHEACGILALQLGIDPTFPALESKVITIGLPGKSSETSFKRLLPQSVPFF